MLQEKLRTHIFYIQVSQVTSGPRRGPTFNDRWWNDRRSWNLRTTNSREKASPKGANHIQSCSCSPPSGTIREYLSLSAGSIPFGHSTSGYSHSPPSGTVECYLRNFSILFAKVVLLAFKPLLHTPFLWKERKINSIIAMIVLLLIASLVAPYLLLNLV